MPDLLRRHLPSLMRTDAVFNAAFALAVLAAAGPLTEAARLPSSAPVLLLAVLAAGNSVLCWRAAGPRGPAAGRATAAIDLVFAIAVAAWAVSGGAGVAPWLRWGASAMAVLALLVAVVKLVGTELHHGHRDGREPLTVEQDALPVWSGPAAAHPRAPGRSTG